MSEDTPKYLTNKEVNKIYELKPSCTFIEDLNNLLNKFIMENKYYKPTKEEIYSSPELLHKDNLNNVIQPFTYRDGNKFIDLKEESYLEDALIKYLDSEDIKELGFEYGEIPCEYNGRAGGFIKKVKEGIELIIECSLGYNNLVKIKRWDSNHNGYNVFFWGNIKNKQELKKVLQMIGVL
jgi:hypothetical protein